MSDLFVGAGNALQRLQPVAIDEESLEEIKLRAKLQPHFLGEPLVVIAEADDFSHFDMGKNDNCLIALDTLGRVVVVEFRIGVARTSDPLLALRYASHIGKLNIEELGKIAHA
ncbi:MAG: hypothetical protein JXA52_03005, partial [Planctomycetes bacterium]|nr:hypothetical protein [Planctomycetota bacterium]